MTNGERKKIIKTYVDGKLTFSKEEIENLDGSVKEERTDFGIDSLGRVIEKGTAFCRICGSAVNGNSIQKCERCGEHWLCEICGSTDYEGKKICWVCADKDKRTSEKFQRVTFYIFFVIFGLIGLGLLAMFLLKDVI